MLANPGHAAAALVVTGTGRATILDPDANIALAGVEDNLALATALKTADNRPRQAGRGPQHRDEDAHGRLRPI